MITEEQAREIIENSLEKAQEVLSYNPKGAEIILNQLLKCDSENYKAFQILGLAKHAIGKNVEAIEIFKYLIKRDPNDANNYNNIALCYASLSKYEQAIQYLLKAIELDSTHHLYWNNLALQYRAIGDYKKSIECFKKSIEINPKSPQVITNLGGVYGELKDLETAKYYFKKAIEIDKNFAPAHVDLAYAYHLSGDWKNGFEEYEWRIEHFTQMIFYKKSYDQSKKWDGKQDISGKKFLIYAEQGIGDGIQFIRYAKFLKQKGAYVIVHCNPVLNRLFDSIEWVDEVFNRDIVNNCGTPFPEYDFQCPIMSLPYLLKNYHISGEPYIFPCHSDAKEQLNKHYGKDTLKIGVVWAGSPAHPYDRTRSIPLREYKPIHDLPGVKLFNLQLDTRLRKYGIGSVDCMDGEIVDYTENCQDMRIVDLTHLISDFLDTAMVVQGLDLVISCDTAIVHLCGAMGVNAWVALPYNPDWRWKLDGKTTPWYNSVRLFRQPKPHDWNSVFQEIKEELYVSYLQNK